MCTEARRHDHVSAKIANFKGAVESGKTLLEQEVRARALRYKQVDATLTDPRMAEPDVQGVREVFAEHERQGLLAKCKRLSTDDFEPVRVIGEGGFGVVHLVKRRGTEELYALKQMSKDHYQRKNVRKRVLAERKILVEAHTRWFVDLHATFQDAKHIFMLMEFVQGGDLIFHLIQRERLNVEETRFYMAELLEALDTVHKCGFAHRDVKPDNIVLTAQGHLKLLDFGLCKHVGVEEQAPAGGNASTASDTPAASKRRGRHSRAVGTPQYMAPEVWLDGDTGQAGDIWALGCITYESLVGWQAFNAGSNADEEQDKQIQIIKKKVMEHERRVPQLLNRGKEQERLSPNSIDFLARILCRKDTRLTATQCRCQPFFFKINFAALHQMDPPIVPEIKHPGDSSYFDDFGVSSLPAAPDVGAGSRIRTDASLDWSTYDFNRVAQELQSPEINIGELIQESANSSV